ncbi:MAG: flagellin [Lachnospiraceae bacterium]|jgi:flagellin|nr:flagellin [Lachnospiraceae bacterium]
MRVAHNIAGMNTSRNQGIVRGDLGKSLEKLSSGYRIVRAGDDAAGLAISESMRAQIAGLDQAMRNVNDGVGMVNTGEGALQEVHAMLHRLETLAIESANGTFDDVARENVNLEKEEILHEIDRICENASFNENELFSTGQPPVPINPPEASKDDIVFQIGPSEEELMNVPRYFMGSKALGLRGEYGNKDMELGTPEKASEAIETIAKAVQAVTVVRSEFGAAQNHLDCTHNNLGVTTENMTEAESRIRDANMPDEITKFTSRNIVLQAAMSMQSQAHAIPQKVLSLLQNA